VEIDIFYHTNKILLVKKEKNMNAKQANQVSIRNYLNSIGIRPVSSNKSSSLYSAPYRADKHPSLKVSHKENLWIDFGNDNKGGTLIDLVLKLNPQYTVSDAILAIEKSTTSFFSFHQQETLSNPDPDHKKQNAHRNNPISVNHQSIAIGQIEIIKVRELGYNTAIANYINSRGIQLETAKLYCSEIYFTVNGQKYFGIGNQNDSGWSIRNKYWKGCSAQGYSYYAFGSHELNVFEGIFDLLSYVEMNHNNGSKPDFLVLNSLVNLKKARPILEDYQTINLNLDHDEAGKTATQHIMHQYPEARDHSSFYSSFKDLNEYHLSITKEQLIIKNQ
jgi:hypothetical protein